MTIMIIRILILCLCYTIPILKTEDEFWSLDEDSKSVNAITELPPNFREWIDDNRDRIEAAETRGKLPYFISDNREEVEEILNPKPIEEASVIRKQPLPKLSKNPSQEEIQNFVNILANNPD